MLKILRARRHQGHRTMTFPEGPPPALPDRFRGLPRVDPGKCADGCAACAEVCPTDAILIARGRSEAGHGTDIGRDDRGSGGTHTGEPGSGGTDVRIDLGRCLFCTECGTACVSGAIRYGDDYRLATRTREDLMLGPDGLRLAGTLDRKIRRLLGRSLKLRVVSAGGCNACEADVNVLTTIGWDIGRFGIQYVASPRHADGILVTGPVTTNMRLALRKTYDAVPSPKIVIASGACAISGGPYRGQSEQVGGADAEIPVDLYIPGCPPHPLTILDGFLRLIGRLPERA